MKTVTKKKKKLRCKIMIHKWKIWWDETVGHYYRKCEHCEEGGMLTPWGWS